MNKKHPQKNELEKIGRLKIKSMEPIYRLVTFGELIQLTLVTAQSSEKTKAIKELRLWAIANGHRIAKNALDYEATCLIQELEPVG